MQYSPDQQATHDYLKLKASNSASATERALYLHVRSKMLRTRFEKVDEIISFLIDELPSHRWW